MNSEQDTTPGQLAEIRLELKAGRHRMDAIESRLEENTAITIQVKDLIEVQNTVRLGYKAAKGLGSFVMWAAGLVLAVGGAWAYIKGWRP